MNPPIARACLLSAVSQPCDLVPYLRLSRQAVSSGGSIGVPYLKQSFWNMRAVKKLKHPGPLWSALAAMSFVLQSHEVTMNPLFALPERLHTFYEQVCYAYGTRKPIPVNDNA